MGEKLGMNLLDIAANLRSELNYVEQVLDQEMHAEEEMLERAILQLLNAGGKRMRPIFVLLAGRFGDFKLEQVGRIAVVLEMIHMASLVHDDVIDDALTRRGNPTVKSQYGNRMAMYAGDFIFAKALMLLSGYQDVRIHQLLSDTIVRMCEGEIEQIRDFYNSNQTVRTYLRRIRRKTALLLEASCQLGALAAGCSDQVIKKLGAYGYAVGMAYQIIDDILDFTSTSDKIGKPVGNDIRQGNLTYPVLYALRNPDYHQRLLTLIHENMSDTEAEEAVQLVRKSGGIEAARTLATGYLKHGLNSLKGLTPRSACTALEKVAKLSIERQV